MSELLRMEHISKRFGNFYANQDINFSVAKGEVHTLLGENGAGKSTLMNILIGLYQPTEGKIFLNGQEVRIESPSQAVKLGIGMVHQHFMLVEAMTVFDNIILGDKHAKGLFIDRAARRKEIEALSEKYGPPKLGTLTMENIVATDAQFAGCYFDGLPEQPIERVSMKNVTITFDPEAKEGQAAMADNRPFVKKLAIYAENVKEIDLHNVKIEGYEGERLHFANVGHFEED